MTNPTPSYNQRLQHEIRYYEDLFRGRPSLEVPPIWDEVEARFAARVQKATGVSNLYQYVARHVAGKQTIDLLGLGSGPCGNELQGIHPLLEANGCTMRLTCVDINAALLEMAEREARSLRIPFTASVQDVNAIALEASSYDVIVAYASLHHFVSLDHIVAQINTALKPGGIFVTVDIPTKNGFLMWDETFEVVNTIWKTLPPRFKIAHTGFPEPTHVEIRENVDYSVGRFECINSEAILPALDTHLETIHYVPALSIARRFFDTQFGPNFDLSQSLDRAIFEYIMELDAYYIDNNLLPPETFFGAYATKSSEN